MCHILLYRKLKNRVAAQTSRDRKKAKMEQMESALQELFAKNEALLTECQTLKSLNHQLRLENAELQERLGSPCRNCTQSRTVEREAGRGPAASRLLPKGPATRPAAALETVVKILLVYLICRTCSTSSKQTSTFSRSRSSRRPCFEISRETLRRLLRRHSVRWVDCFVC